MDTITGYSIFVADTLIKSSEVNENFSNHRGDLSPINTDTASASDSIHDLGTLDHQWKDLYLSGQIYYNGLAQGQANQAIVNGQSSFATITTFDAATFSSIKIGYEISRITDQTSTMGLSEVRLFFKNTATGWQISEGVLHGEDVEVTLDVTTVAGVCSFGYTSVTMTGVSITSSMKYKAEAFLI